VVIIFPEGDNDRLAPALVAGEGGTYRVSQCFMFDADFF
jgi:hypothetical protein